MDSQIQLTDVIFVDREYIFKHPHMLHKHENVLEVLYIASENVRYLVGNHEYAVTAGDFVICNANVPHGEDPFQEHHIQTYCLFLSKAKLKVEEDEQPVISLGKKNAIGFWRILICTLSRGIGWRCWGVSNYCY